MKLWIAGAAAALVLVSGAAFAQESTQLELTKTVIQTEKKMIVAKNLGLTESEGQGFWPVYNEYQEKLAGFGERRIQLIKTYAENFENLSDEMASDLIDESLEIVEGRAKVRRDYKKKFDKVLPPKQVARYYQIESKLQAIVDYEIAGNIPLVR